MAIGDKQKLITEIVGSVLNIKPKTDIKFDWFINRHTPEHFGSEFQTIDKIFKLLRGDLQANQNKKLVGLTCDAYFDGQYNFIFEFDEYQHFSSCRLSALSSYSDTLKLNFNIDQWKKQCQFSNREADSYRKAKKTTDFNFEGGRTAQRAYLDCFRDLLPCQHNLNPTLRINEFEVLDVHSNNKIAHKKLELLIETKLNSCFKPIKDQRLSINP